MLLEDGCPGLLDDGAPDELRPAENQQPRIWAHIAPLHSRAHPIEDNAGVPRQ